MKKIILFVFSIFLISCSTPTKQETNPVDQVDLSAYFPMQIGDDFFYLSRVREIEIYEKFVVDTLWDDNNNLVYKVKTGPANFPNGSYLYEYYCADNLGFWQYFCVNETCIDTINNIITPDFKMLRVKSNARVNDEWDSSNIHFKLEKLLESIDFTYGDSTYTYKDVVVIQRKSSYSEAPFLEYYARGIGFIGNGNSHFLIQRRVRQSQE